jgi:hypothetical protein
VDWLFVLKTKPRGHVELVQDENEDTSVQDEVFQVSELVEPYELLLRLTWKKIQFFVFSMIVLLMLTQRS